MLEPLRKRLKSRDATRFDVIGAGECSLDDVWILQGPVVAGKKTRAIARDCLGGGQVATAMVAAARLGLRSAFMGAVGDDSAGEQVCAGLSAEEVDVSALRRVGGARTRTALILVDESGERTIVECGDARLRESAADLNLAATSLNLAALEQTRILHLDATDLPAAVLLARAARQRGVLVSLDVDAARPGLAELLPFVDLCVTSQGLPEELSGKRELGSALSALRAKTSEGFVACTLGARGAAALDLRNGSEHLILAPPFLPERMVDTTACGDTFRAALLCAIINEGVVTVPAALRFANAAASLKCRDLGRRGCPSRSEVDRLISS